MSFVRRVKSFSIKKYKSADELKNDDHPPRLTPRPKRRPLVREKSASMEHVPLRIDIEKNDLFIKQKAKMKEHESEPDKPVVVRRTQIKKRKSVSFDEARFSKCIQEFNENPVQLRHVGDRNRMRSRYKTVDVIQDLITEFDNGPKDTVDSVNKPANFPVDEEEEVQLRQPRSLLKPERVERPKTYGSTLTKKKEEPLEFRGLSRLEIDKDICVKIRTRETLRFHNGYLQLLDDRGNTKATIRNNLTLKKGVKIIGKKELEMTDIDKRIYRLYFDSSKDAKLFVEIEKSYHMVPSTSPFRNIGPWNQLRRLLKKRSSRDLLESKGIIKNEPIFGNTLDELCDEDNPVPEVITRIIVLIEEKQNITSLGLYRASANLAVVQNIRFEINCGRWEILEKHRNDVDVLAGTLKLFFRELKQPLISYEVYQELHNFLRNKTDSKDDISTIIAKLPKPNKNTLIYIIKHLLKVCQHKEHNKMDFHNISICWGPSLITLPDNCIDLVAQTTEFTRITEELLSYYSTRIDQTLDVIEEAKTPDFVYEIIRKLTETIEASIEVEGIYRKSGSNMKIDRILKQIEKQDLDFSKNDIHDLCCALKKYITSIRESIVPDEFFHRYYEICDNLNDNLLRDEVRRMVDDLPRKEVVFLLFDHLNKVVSYDRKNKMSFSVLSDIWMTTLMANVSAQTYKKKMPKYSKLFLILMNLNENVLPDLVATPKFRTWSKYDNVPDDINNDAETSDDKLYTKL